MTLEYFGSQRLIDLGMVEYTSYDEVEKSCRLLSIMQYKGYAKRRSVGEVVVVFKDRATMKAGVVKLDKRRVGYSEFLGWLHGALAIDNPSLSEMKKFIRENFFCEE